MSGVVGKDLVKEKIAVGKPARVDGDNQNPFVKPSVFRNVLVKESGTGEDNIRASDAGFNIVFDREREIWKDLKRSTKSSA